MARPCPLCGCGDLGHHCTSTTCPWGTCSHPGCGVTVNWSTLTLYDNQGRVLPWPKKPAP